MVGKRHVITLIPGDGIGPEVVGATVRVVEALCLDVVREEVEAGGDVAVKYGSPVPDHMFASVRMNGVALKGPITTPVGGGFPSANVTIRKKLGL